MVVLQRVQGSALSEGECCWMLLLQWATCTTPPSTSSKLPVYSSPGRLIGTRLEWLRVWASLNRTFWPSEILAVVRVWVVWFLEKMFVLRFTGHFRLFLWCTLNSCRFLWVSLHNSARFRHTPCLTLLQLLFSEGFCGTLQTVDFGGSASPYVKNGRKISHRFSSRQKPTALF